MVLSADMVAINNSNSACDMSANESKMDNTMNNLPLIFYCAKPEKSICHHYVHVGMYFDMDHPTQVLLINLWVMLRRQRNIMTSL